MAAGVSVCTYTHSHTHVQMYQSRLDPITNTAWTTAKMFRCAESLPSENTRELKWNEVGDFYPALFCLSSQHKLPFPPINNNFIGSVCSNGAEDGFCMARNKCEAKQWFLMWNMAAESHLWHPVLSPPAYLRKQVASCTPIRKRCSWKTNVWKNIEKTHCITHKWGNIFSLWELRGRLRRSVTSSSRHAEAPRRISCGVALWRPCSLLHNLHHNMIKLHCNQDFTSHWI